MIQDIQPKCYHNEYTPRPIREDDVVFVFRDREVLLHLMVILEALSVQLGVRLLCS